MEAVLSENNRQICLKNLTDEPESLAPAKQETINAESPNKTNDEKLQQNSKQEEQISAKIAFLEKIEGESAKSVIITSQNDQEGLPQFAANFTTNEKSCQIECINCLSDKGLRIDCESWNRNEPGLAVDVEPNSSSRITIENRGDNQQTLMLRVSLRSNDPKQQHMVHKLLVSPKRDRIMVHGEPIKLTVNQAQGEEFPVIIGNENTLHDLKALIYLQTCTSPEDQYLTVERTVKDSGSQEEALTELEKTFKDLKINDGDVIKCSKSRKRWFWPF